MPKPLTATTNADTLLELRERLVARGLESPMLDLRLRYNEQAQVLQQYLAHVYTTEGEQPKRIYPEFLPTQASGRWSVKKPPVNNFPPDIRDVVIPDHGHIWVAWDLDAIEAKIVAAFTHDRDDLDAFTNRYDIHTITACRMTGMPLPPDLRDPHQSAESADWRAKLQWEGKDDKRRVLAKVRYALLYGRDEKAIHGSKYERDFVKMGFARERILQAARLFLRAKPNLTAWKRRTWDEVLAKGEARTIFGRRRRLFGNREDRMKQGLNHKVQGSVTDMVNLSMIEIDEYSKGRWRLIYPSHDAAKFSVPVSDLQDGIALKDQPILQVFKRAVEREWDIDGEKIISTATWHIYHADGSVTHL